MNTFDSEVMLNFQGPIIMLFQYYILIYDQYVYLRICHDYIFVTLVLR